MQCAVISNQVVLYRVYLSRCTDRGMCTTYLIAALMAFIVGSYRYVFASGRADTGKLVFMCIPRFLYILSLHDSTVPTVVMSCLYGLF